MTEELQKNSSDARRVMTDKQEPVSAKELLSRSTKTNKGDLAKNEVREEDEVTVDPVQCNAGPCEKKSEKEKRHVEERNQGEGEEKTEECFKEPCLENAKREEEDEDVKSKPTENNLQEEEWKKKQKAVKDQKKKSKKKGTFLNSF